MRTRALVSLVLLSGAAIFSGSACGEAFSFNDATGTTGGGGSTTSTGTEATSTGSTTTGTSTSTGTTSTSTGTSSTSTSTASTGTGMCTDADMDGVTTCQGDCDDNDPSVYPAHPEICGDGKDNDCNNKVDDGCSNIGTYVSTSTGDDNNPGTQQKPVQTIAKGMANAITIGNGAEVYVAKGHYPEDVKLVEGVSLNGGFDPSNWMLDPKNNDTAILPQSADGVVADPTITRKTHVSGFRLQGKNNQSTGGAFGLHGAAISLFGGSPKLLGNVINGPDEPSGVSSAGVLIVAPSQDPAGALIDKNLITGGPAGETSAGVALVGAPGGPPVSPGANATISRNRITGGTGKRSFGVQCSAGGAQTIIDGNAIDAGLSNGGNTWALVVGATPSKWVVTVNANAINTDPASSAGCIAPSSPGGWCGGIDSQASDSIITNNVVFGIKSQRSAAMWLRNPEVAPGKVVLNSNYLDGGGTNNVAQSISSAITITLLNGANGLVGRVRNNILSGGQGAQRYGVYEDSAVGKVAHPEVLAYNDFNLPMNSAADTLYRFWDGATGTPVNQFATLGTLLPQATNNLQGNPMVDATLHLMAGSPCIDTGVATEAPTTDFEGDARPKGAGFDIGPDEH
jgi:Putative metal-binding motif